MYKTVPKASFRLIFYYAFPVGLLFFLGVEIFDRYSSGSPFSTIDYRQWIGVITFIALLTGANLYCEVQKWRVLMSRNCSQKLAWKAIMAGLVSGFLTPNRIGDMAGKTLAVPAEIRSESLVASIAGSLLQGIVTVCLGLAALLFYPALLERNWFDFLPNIYVSAGIGLLIAAGIYFWWKSKHWKKIAAIRVAISRLSAVTWLRAGGWALLRYLIFSVQLYVALVAFGLAAHWLETFSAIALLYLFQSYFPLSSFGDIGVREFFAIILFSPFLEFSALAAAATLLIWTLNVALPVAFAATQWPKLVSNTSK